MRWLNGRARSPMRSAVRSQARAARLRRAVAPFLPFGASSLPRCRRIARICWCAGMSQSMTPSFGARFELLRRHVDRQGALYDVTIFLPQGSQRYTPRSLRLTGTAS